MSHKNQMSSQGYVGNEMDDSPSAPSYEEAMKYPPLPRMESTLPPPAQPVMLQPQPMHQINPQPPVVQSHVQTIVHHTPIVGPNRTRLTCPSCKQNIQTNVDYVASIKTHFIALLLCIFGCWCCVCCPYCMDDCRNGNHTCPNCGQYIGTYSG